jgi:hypothetical protein
MDFEDRHSKAFEPELIHDPAEKAQREVKNGFRQFDRATEQIYAWLQPERIFKLRPSAILDLNWIALDGLRCVRRCLSIHQSRNPELQTHAPRAHLVPELVERSLRLRELQLVPFAASSSFVHTMAVELDSPLCRRKWFTHNTGSNIQS